MKTIVGTTSGSRIKLEPRGGTETSLGIVDSTGESRFRLACDTAELYHAVKAVYELQNARRKGA